MLAAVLLAALLGGATLIVSPQGPYMSLAEALAAARDGDTVEVRGGRYSGNLVINKSVSVVGVGAPVLDGRGKGTVVHITAPDVVLKGFVVRGSGENLEREDAGILVSASRVRIEDNRLEDVLFGIGVQEAPEAVLRGNTIEGKALPVALKGDAIRLWASPRSTVEDNTVRGARDLLFWYSDGTTIRRNRVTDGRYGLHLMKTSDTLVEGNALEDNSVGVYLMYARNVSLLGNTLARNRGPSGFGIGLKDTEDVVVRDNVVLDNRVGVYMDTSPNATHAFQRNAFAYNGVGIVIFPDVQGATFSENSFVDNMEQVSIRGGGDLKGNVWTRAGRGNFWSDYVGYDGDGDGRGDVAYRSERLFENMMDRYPLLRLFIFSPAAQAVDSAARAFPLVQPQPKMVDPAPLMEPSLPALLTDSPSASALPLLGASLLLAGLALGLVGAGRGMLGRGRAFRRDARAREDTPVVAVRSLSKRFDGVQALADVSFTVAAGEAVALWGDNGAGKTTILKCILGLVAHQGSIQVGAWNAARQGKQARQLLGYVPQDPAFYPDMTVGQTVDLFRRLRKVDITRGADVLRIVGLEEQRDKAVRALSGGMKQRLALAVALLGDPPVLLLDEPTANLDTSGREAFIGLLQRLKADGKTLVLTSHRFSEVEVLCDRVVALKQGRVEFVTAPRDAARSLGLRTEVWLRVDADAVERAVSLLRADGFSVTRNGHGVRVQVDARRKLQPLRLLEGAGVQVEDMDVGDQSWN